MCQLRLIVLFLITSITNTYVFAYEITSVPPTSSIDIPMKASYYDAGLKFSADGRFVVFTAFHQAYSVSDNRYSKAYLRDRLHNETRLISISSNGQILPADQVQISADGKRIVFRNSQAIYLFDQAIGYAVPIGDRRADSIALSPDGNFLAYVDPITKKLIVMHLKTHTEIAEFRDVDLMQPAIALSHNAQRILYNRIRYMDNSGRPTRDTVLTNLSSQEMVLFLNGTAVNQNIMSADGGYLVMYGAHGYIGTGWFYDGFGVSNNGKSIEFFRGVSSAIYLYEAQTGETRALSSALTEQLFAGAAMDSNLHNSNVRISPNGRYIAYGKCVYCHIDTVLAYYPSRHYLDMTAYNYGVYFVYDQVTKETRLIKNPTLGRTLEDTPVIYGVDNNGFAFLGSIARNAETELPIHFVIDSKQGMLVNLYDPLRQKNTHVRPALSN